MITTPCILASKVNSEGRATKNAEKYRLVWEKERGPIPSGFDLDHQCHNEDLSCVGGRTCLHRGCYNLDHLRLATRKENLAHARWSDERRAKGRETFKKTWASWTDEQRQAFRDKGRANARKRWDNA